MRNHIPFRSAFLVVIPLLSFAGCHKHRDVKVVNMIPATLSGETNQDSEPKLTVDIEDHRLMVGSAFTPNPAGTASGLAPVYVSQDGGDTWALNNIVPSAGAFSGTGDITESATHGRKLYAGILKFPGFLTLNELFSNDFTSTTPTTVQASRNSVDQPFVSTTTVAGSDRVYIGNNDFHASPRTATVDFSPNGNAPYKSIRIEPRGTSGQDGPSIRVAIARDETVYAVYFGWRSFTGSIATSDVVVVRDDHGATGATPFTDLKDGGGVAGVFAAHDVKIPWSNAPTLGQERIGSTLSIAVDPKHSSVVYVAWGDRVGSGDIYTLHIRRSTDRGVTWSGDLRTITNATDCSLAITEDSVVGFLYQQVTGSPPRWETHLEQSKNAFTSVHDAILASVPADVPVHTFLPYIGDYNFLLALDDEFRGIFSANNTPDMANFPHGVKYQRKADFTTKTLQDGSGGTVAISIDPFYFRVEAED